MRISLFAIFAFASIVHAESTPTTRPNIVYVLCDDLGYGDISANNSHSKLNTVCADGLAKSGMRFTDAHSPSAVCTPTRYGILTGRYCWRTHLKTGVLDGIDPPLIEADRLTVASLLKQNGYATACVGKWHLGLGWQYKADAPKKKHSADDIDYSIVTTAGPQTVGFDYSYIIPASLDMDPYVYLENGKATQLASAHIAGSARPKFWRGGPMVPGFKHEAVLPEFTAKAVSWIDGRSKSTEPFFLYLPFPSPHDPHVPSAQFAGKSGLGEYGDYVLETDWALGQVLDALSRNHFDDNTLVIFTSDNGAHSKPVHLDEKFGHYSNGDFRGQKSDDWDGGHRIPFIARWPGQIAAGSTCDQTVCLTDLMATVADIVHAKLPNNAAEDSCDILPLLQGHTDKPIRDSIVHHSINGFFAIREGPWKLILAKGSGGWSQPEKEAPKNAPPIQLYNMNDDPSEEHNVESEHADIVGKLKGMLKKYEDDGRSVPVRE